MTDKEQLHKITKQIKYLCQKNPGQLLYKEYLYVAEMLYHKAPCNFLVFGVGKDSKLWLDINKDGKTIFIENNLKWSKYTEKLIPGIEIIPAEYTTTRTEWEDIIDKPDRLTVELPKSIYHNSWDLIFIDAPLGKIFGRMQSIYTASTLFCRDFLIHDINRPIEKFYSDKYLDEHVKTVYNLAHYRKYFMEGV